MKGRIVGAVVLAFAVLAVPSPAALADSDPANDSLVGAEGPLVGGVVYTGSTEDESSATDWYFFYAGSQVQLDIRVFSKNECGSSEEVGGVVALTNADGQSISSASLYPVLGIEEAHIKYTTPPGGGQFYLHAGCSIYEEGVETYNFVIEPASGVVAGPSPWFSPVPLGEPNNSSAEAIGPLEGDIDYEDATSTINDPDWSYFYSLGQHPIDIRITPRSGCGEADLEFHRLQRGELNRIGGIDSGVDQVSHLPYTTPKGITPLFIETACERGLGGYRFRITPKEVLVSAACYTAIHERTDVRKRRASLRARLLRARHDAARWRRARARIKRKIRKVIKPRLAAASAEADRIQAVVAASCG
jgi:hypothetical protein